MRLVELGRRIEGLPPRGIPNSQPLLAHAGEGFCLPRDCPWQGWGMTLDPALVAQPQAGLFLCHMHVVRYFGSVLPPRFRLMWRRWTDVSHMVLNREAGLYQKPETDPNETRNLSHALVSAGYTPKRQEPDLVRCFACYSGHCGKRHSPTTDAQKGFRQAGGRVRWWEMRLA